MSVTLSRRIAAPNCVALPVSDPRPLSRFLGDCEKSNHRDWVVRRAEERGYRHPDLPLRIVKNALRDLHALATQADEAQVVKDVLAEFFKMPAPNGTSKARSDPARPRPDLPEPVDEVLGVSRVKGGFKVVLRGEGRTETNFRITAVYDVRRGRPKWSAADFDMTNQPTRRSCWSAAA